ncbi:hypothetical protein [Pseudomonas viridiflava]
MDLVDVLKKKIDVLDDGEHRPGLKAVLLHIETAFRHLSRGQDGDDDTAFTDAIYRTNQAFEGSVKEAYRVLTGNEPSKKRPYDIESYLEKNNIFRPRVLSQLTNYRTEWRNPSAHDYKLDFDESEAFLAIVSVSAFACLLLDQISERLSYMKSQAEADAQKAVLLASLKQAKNSDLIVKASELLSEFCASHIPFDDNNRLTETQVLGALHGFLSSVAPELKVETEVSISELRSFRADLVISRGDEKLVVELRRGAMRQHQASSIIQLERYLFVTNIKSGIVLFYPDAPHRMETYDIKTSNPDYKLVMLAPLGSVTLL